MDYAKENYDDIRKFLDNHRWDKKDWLLFTTISVSFFMWGIALSIAPLTTTWPFVPASSDVYIIAASPSGLLSGNLIMGYVSDKLGRKNIFITTMAVTVAGLLAIAITYNYIILIISIFIAEFGLGGDETLSLSILAEYLPVKQRGFALIESSNMANTGIAVMSGIFIVFSSSLFNQKISLIIISIIAIIFLIIARLKMGEGIRWKKTEAQKSKINFNAKNTLKFLSLSLIGIAIIVGFAFSDLVLGPYHFQNYTDEIIFFPVLVASITGILGGYFMGKARRKRLAIAGFTGMFIAWIPVVLFLHEIVYSIFLLILFLCLSAVFSEMSWASREMLEPENFITEHRGTGIGSVRTVGYVIYIITVFALAGAAVSTYAVAIAIIFFSGFAGAVIYLFNGRETYNDSIF